MLSICSGAVPFEEIGLSGSSFDHSMVVVRQIRVVHNFKSWRYLSSALGVA